MPQVQSGVVGVNSAFLDEEDSVMSPLKRKFRPSPIQMSKNGLHLIM